MKIQKGIVKYKDRTDIVCTYGVTDDGSQFYFLDENDEKKFKNGSRVASTALVEAIDPMVKASNIGVIDDNGKIVVPFVNRAIKAINDDIILVEISTPITESVKEAISLKSDPLSATKLVSTPALIKDKLNAKMGSDGRYIFNDQFSEATICDINGNNLVNGEYYSFIGLSDGKLYLSKNTVDSDITEYSILPPDVQSNVTPAGDNNDIDVSDVSVSQDVVENALSDTPVTTVNNTVSEENISSVSSEAESSVVSGEQVSVDQIQSLGEESVSGQPSIPNLPTEQVMESVGNSTSDIVIPQVEEDVIEDNIVSDDNNVTSVENAAPVQEDVVEAPVEESVPAQEDVVEAPVEESAPAQEDVVEAPVEESAPAQEDVVEAPVEESAPAQEDVVEAPVEESAPAQEDVVEAPAEESAPAQEDVVEAPVEESVPAQEDVVETPVEESVPAQEDVVETPAEETELKINFADDPEEEKTEESEVAEDNSPEEDLVSVLLKEEEEKLATKSLKNNKKKKENKSIIIDTEDEYNDSVIDDIEEDDIFASSTFKVDSIDTEDEFDNDVYSIDRSSTQINNFDHKDSIMADVAKSMTSLIKQNKTQKAEIANYREKIEKISASRRTIADKAKIQEQKIDVLSTKVRNYENNISRLEAKIQSLESRFRDQSRIIEAQEHELGVLRPQLQGKEDLIKLLADASLLLNDDSAA